MSDPTRTDLFGVLQNVVGALQDGDADKAMAIGESALQEIHEITTPRKYCLGGAILPLNAVEDERGVWHWAVQDASGRVIKRFVLRDSAHVFAGRHNTPNDEGGHGSSVMPHFTVGVLHDEGSRPRIWKVAASTEDDAIQLAFALDGGWPRIERNATDMLELAKAYCSVRPQ